MEIARPDPDAGLTIEDVKLVFGAVLGSGSSGSHYCGDCRFGPTLRIDLKLVKSDDRLCPARIRGIFRVARLLVREGKNGRVDAMDLLVVGCPHQSAEFRGSIGPKSAVKVAIVVTPR